MASSKTSSEEPWTWEENKTFEDALAIHGEEIVNRWEIVANFVGKSVEEVKQRYQDLVDDVKAIEAGLVPLPYKDDEYSKPETGLSSPLPEPKDSSTSETSPNLEEGTIAESSKETPSAASETSPNLEDEGEIAESSKVISETPDEEKK